jgi:acyl-CoA reductase-like NAD-dependent aldehyde dehydrogenase
MTVREPVGVVAAISPSNFPTFAPRARSHPR